MTVAPRAVWILVAALSLAAGCGRPEGLRGGPAADRDSGSGTVAEATASGAAAARRVGEGPVAGAAAEGGLAAAEPEEEEPAEMKPPPLTPTAEERARGIDPNDPATWPDGYRGPGIERALRQGGGIGPGQGPRLQPPPDGG